MPLEAASIALWGFGREGRASYDFLRERRADVPITVLGDDPAPPADLPADCAYIGGPASDAAVAAGQFALVVKSPGISIVRPAIAAAKAAGTRFTSGTNLWFEHRRRGIVLGFTGTKGKSTMATLATCLIGNAGKDVRLLGNTGTPALSQQGGADATVLELSSYQLADLAHAPDFGAINNLFPEHVPWHGSLERYYSDKLRLATLDPAMPLVANRAADELAARLVGRGNVTWANTPESFAVDGDGLTYRGQPVRVTGPCPEGQHNLTNLAVAAALVHRAGLLADPLHLDLTGFAMLPHRQQVWLAPDRTLVVDDSISTVPQATLAALDRFADRRVHLILGGSDRGQDYTALIAILPARRMGGIYLLPDTGHVLAPVLAEVVPQLPAVVCADLADAVSEAAAGMQPGDCLLLSPGAPSFTQFANFEERGRQFVALCGQHWRLLPPRTEASGG